MFRSRSVALVIQSVHGLCFIDDSAQAMPSTETDALQLRQRNLKPGCSTGHSLGNRGVKSRDIYPDNLLLLLTVGTKHS